MIFLFLYFSSQADDDWATPSPAWKKPEFEEPEWPTESLAWPNPEIYTTPSKAPEKAKKDKTAIIAVVCSIVGVVALVAALFIVAKIVKNKGKSWESKSTTGQELLSDKIEVPI